MNAQTRGITYRRCSCWRIMYDCHQLVNNMWQVRDELIQKFRAMEALLEAKRQQDPTSIVMCDKVQDAAVEMFKAFYLLDDQDPEAVALANKRHNCEDTQPLVDYVRNLYRGEVDNIPQQVEQDLQVAEIEHQVEMEQPPAPRRRRFQRPRVLNVAHFEMISIEGHAKRRGKYKIKAKLRTPNGTTATHWLAWNEIGELHIPTLSAWLDSQMQKQQWTTYRNITTSEGFGPIRDMIEAYKEAQWE